MRTYTMNTPLFGKLYLVPHLAEDAPAERMVGYVDFGDETHLHAAIWLGEGWLDRKGKPFSKRVAHWYHPEKPDGSRPF